MVEDDDTMPTDDTEVMAQAPAPDADAIAIPLVLVTPSLTSMTSGQLWSTFPIPFLILLPFGDIGEDFVSAPFEQLVVFGNQEPGEQNLYSTPLVAAWSSCCCGSSGSSCCGACRLDQRPL